jgi:ribosomal protein S6--L-glutamate ligase
MSMKIAVLGPSPKVASHSTKRIIDEAKLQFRRVDFVPVADVTLNVGKGASATFGDVDLSSYDYIIPRIDSKRASVAYPVFLMLDRTDVKKPYPASTILIAHNKFLTLMELTKRNIPIPQTWITGSKEVAGSIVDRQKLPLIMKLLAGFGGEGVMIMEGRAAAKAAIHTMKTLHQEVLIEEYLPNPGEDIRAIVAGDEVIASFKRIAAPGSKKANIHLGGRGVDYKLTSEMKEIAVKSCRAVESRICAVDMVESRGIPYVIEVNINPGLRGIEKATGINVAKRMVDYVKSEVKR